MNDGLVIDHLGRVNRTLDHLMKVLAVMYTAEQDRKALETAGSTRLYTFNLSAPQLPAPHAVQILPNNGARQKVGIYNIKETEGGDILLSPNFFDPTSILQQISDPAHPNTILPSPNQAVEIGVLPAGASITIYSTSSIWAYNLGGPVLLSLAESVYQVPNRMATATPPGYDGAIGAGYGKIPGANTDDSGVVVSKRLV